MEDHAYNLVKTLLSYQQHSLFCDTVIVAKNQVVFAHSAILAATCPAMFNLLNHQPFNNQKTNIIQLEKFDSDLIQDLVRFFYTGQIDSSRTLELQEVCQMLGITVSTTRSTIAACNKEFCVEMMSGIVTSKSNANRKAQEITTEPSVICGHKDDKPVEIATEYKLITANKNEENTEFLQTDKSETEAHDRSISCKHSIISKREIAFDNAVCKTPNGYLHEMNQGEQKHCIDKDSRHPNTVIDADKNLKLKRFRHQNKLGKEVEFVCTLCEVSFQTQRALNIHKYSHNLMDDGTYQCHMCSKIFSMREYLRKHVRGHYNQGTKKQARKYHCRICQRHFRTAARLNSHANVHTGEKPFACVVCGKCYADKEYLVKHQRLHRNEKPYLCEDCGLSFTFRQGYTSHCKLHTKEKPYVCSECSCSFARSSALRAHLRVHMMPHTFPCSQCSKTFPTAKQQAVHVISVHRKDSRKKFQCQYCNRLFQKRYIFLQHLKGCQSLMGRTFEERFSFQSKLKQQGKCCKNLLAEIVRNCQLDV